MYPPLSTSATSAHLHTHTSNLLSSTHDELQRSTRHCLPLFSKTTPQNRRRHRRILGSWTRHRYHLRSPRCHCSLCRPPTSRTGPYKRGGCQSYTRADTRDWREERLHRMRRTGQPERATTHRKDRRHIRQARHVRPSHRRHHPPRAPLTRS